MFDMLVNGVWGFWLTRLKEHSVMYPVDLLKVSLLFG